MFIIILATNIVITSHHRIKLNGIIRRSCDQAQNDYDSPIVCLSPKLFVLCSENKLDLTEMETPT